jgi:hypothetical protein
MAQGLQIFDAAGLLQFDTNARLGRLGYVGPCNTSGIPNNTWTQVVDPAYAGTLWGVCVPNYQIDIIDNQQLYFKIATVQVDPGNRPGQIMISGNWYNSDTGTVTDYPYQNSTLIYGVY